MLKDMKVLMRLVEEHELLRDYFSSQRAINRRVPIGYDDLWILFPEGLLFTVHLPTFLKFFLP